MRPVRPSSIYEKMKFFCKISMPGAGSLSKPLKRIFGFSLSAAEAREITDALVIFSISTIAYKAVADWGGLWILHTILGTQLEKPLFLYFCGMALVMFSVRRIVDQ